LGAAGAALLAGGRDGALRRPARRLKSWLLPFALKFTGSLAFLLGRFARPLAVLSFSHSR
jgi:hypothetical protein